MCELRGKSPEKWKQNEQGQRLKLRAHRTQGSESRDQSWARRNLRLRTEVGLYTDLSGALGAEVKGVLSSSLRIL